MFYSLFLFIFAKNILQTNLTIVFYEKKIINYLFLVGFDVYIGIGRSAIPKPAI